MRDFIGFFWGFEVFYVIWINWGQGKDKNKGGLFSVYEFLNMNLSKVILEKLSVFEVK